MGVDRQTGSPRVKRPSAVPGAVALLVATSALAAPKASFDCAKATTIIEKSICSDAELATLDAELARLYKVRLASADAALKSRLKAEQRGWQRTRDEECAATGSACLKRLYTSRIDELKAGDGVDPAGIAGIYDYRTWHGTMVITRRGKGKYTVGISSERGDGNHLCDAGVDGMTYDEKSRTLTGATPPDPDDNDRTCPLTVTFTGNTATVSTPDVECFGLCDPGFAGEYTRQ